MPAESSRTETPCFFEQQPAATLFRRGAVEGLGTFLLALVATGTTRSGSIGQALATAGALVALIVAFGAVSGGHFNPLITILQWLAGERSRRCTIVYCVCQIWGGLAGGWVTMLYAPPPPASAATTPSLLLFTSEFACSAALMLVVFACSRSGNRTAAPFAVGAWLASAILVSPSSSIANPAMALAGASLKALNASDIVRALQNSGAECAGAILGLLLMFLAYPRVQASESIAAGTSHA